MNINEAIEKQVAIIRCEADKMQEHIASDAKLMSDAFTLSSLTANLRSMIRARDDGKLTW